VSDDDFGAILRQDAVWAEPPAGLERRVLSGLRPAPAARRIHRRPIAVAAAAAGLAAVTALGLTAGGSSTMRLTGEGARADVHVRDTSSGVELRFDVEGLPPAAPGTFYEGWVVGPRGAVAIGTFHLRDGSRDVVLWAGVDLADYPRVTVTLQREGAGPASSGLVLLAGDVPESRR
jgi:hypothetical protein